MRIEHQLRTGFVFRNQVVARVRRGGSFTALATCVAAAPVDPGRRWVVGQLLLACLLACFISFRAFRGLNSWPRSLNRNYSGYVRMSLKINAFAQGTPALTDAASEKLLSREALKLTTIKLLNNINETNHNVF